MPFEVSVEYFLGLTAWLAALAASLVALLIWRRRQSERGSRRVRWANTGLSMWTFVAALTMVELYVVVAFDESDGGNLTNISKRWYVRHVEPDEKIMRFGDGAGLVYRDARPFPRRLSEGQCHICFVGDSFTFGHGIPRVADRFSDRIGASLERKRPGRFVVSNLSEVGRDLLWAEVLLRRMVLDGNEFPVQTVVLTVCLNDVETFDMRSIGPGDGWRLPDFFLVRDTYFPNLAYIRIRQGLSAHAGRYDANLKEAYESAPGRQFLAKFDDLRQSSAEGDIDLRIVIFPFVHRFRPEYPFRDAHRLVAERCRDIGLPVLDLLSVLEPHANEGLTVGLFDAHPNERANRLAAEAIEEGLLADLLER